MNNERIQPLKSHDFDECDLDGASEKASIQRQIYCSIKLLLVIFIVTQLILYDVTIDLKFFHRNTSQLDSNYNVEKVTTNREIIRQRVYGENYKINTTISTRNSSNDDDNDDDADDYEAKASDLSIARTNDLTLASTKFAISAQSGINQTILGTFSIINDGYDISTNNITANTNTNTTAIIDTNTNTNNTINTNTNNTMNTSKTTIFNFKAIDDYDDADLKDSTQTPQTTNENYIKKKPHETENLITNTAITRNYSNKSTTTKTTTSIITGRHLRSLNQENTTSAKDIYYSSVSPTSPFSSTSATSHMNPNITKSKRSIKLPYFISTTTCHIPFTDPFTKEVLKIFKPPYHMDCAKGASIVSVSFDATKTQYILHINYTVARTFIKSPNGRSVETDLRCCYRQIERSGSGAMADKKFTLLPCAIFHQDFEVPHHIQGIIVDCSSKSQKKLLQQDAFAFIQVHKTKDKKQAGRSWNTLKANGPQNLGVLMIGIDALSRINLRRTMPKVVQHLQANGWYELRGYNKVGDNTFPNLMALLAGLTKRTTFSKCKLKNVGGLDTCNLLWRKFKEHGFKTAYAEDTTYMSTFNFNLKGFLKPPTDHYFQPIALAMEGTMKTRTKANIDYCIGRKQAGEYVYDYAMEFATRYRNHSNFGFFWTNSFSHNSFLTASTMDTRMVRYFKELKLKGILEQSVVIFLSDHGQRFGPLLQLPEGFLEERLPFMFLSLPTWLKKQYPEYVKSLEVNQKRLVTPFDIYMTVQDLLHVAAPEYTVVPAEDCSNAQSIFNEIPENRTCLDACIPDAWCTCIPYAIVSTKDATVKRVTHLVLDKMNRYFVTKNLTSLCSDLTLRKILKAQTIASYQMEVGKASNYVIEFVTNPKTDPATIFSATASYDSVQDKIHLNVEDIARHSKYEKTAKCTNDKQAKLYCICRDSVKSE